MSHRISRSPLEALTLSPPRKTSPAHHRRNQSTYEDTNLTTFINDLIVILH